MELLLPLPLQLDGLELSLSLDVESSLAATGVVVLAVVSKVSAGGSAPWQHLRGAFEERMLVVVVVNDGGGFWAAATAAVARVITMVTATQSGSAPKNEAGWRELFEFSRGQLTSTP
jgi:hypothetical protein